MASLSGFKSVVSPYVERFGVISGIRVGLAMRRARWGTSPGTLVRVKVPGVRESVVLRAGTSDAGICDQVFLHEFQMPSVAIKPRIIVDIGANVGLTSVQYANLFPSAKIIAVEPEAGNYESLLKNIAPYENIQAIQRGVWNRECRLRIANAGSTECAYRFEECEYDGIDPGCSVEAVSVPWLLRTFSLDRIDLLKIDIEGSEVELFGGGRPAWMDHVHTMLVELHDRIRPGCEAALAAILSEGDRTFKHREYTVVEFNHGERGD